LEGEAFLTLEKVWASNWGVNLRAIAAILLIALLSGLATGMSQAVVLRIQVVFRSGIGWAGATAAGGLVYGVFSLMALERFGAQGTGGFLAGLLAGAVSAATAGILQSRLLLRDFGPPGWTMGWTLISVGAELLGILALFPLWYSLSFPAIPAYLEGILAFAVPLTPKVISAAATGLALGRWLKRRAPAPPVDAA
jgi:hypothetical protein